MALGSFASRATRRARTLPERHGGPAILVALALVVALGFGLRLDAALNPSLDPGEATIVAYQGNDSKAYGEIAEELYRTGRYGTEEMRNPADWSPLAPFFHAGVYFVTGGVNPDVGLAAVALLGGIMVLLVYLLGRRLGGPAVGLPAALLAAIYPAFIDNSEQILSEPIAAFTLTGAVLAFLWASDPGRRLWAWIVPGTLLGLTALARPEYLMFVLFLGLLALVLVARRRDLRVGLAAAALFACAFALVLAPWTLRNYVVLDRFVPVTTGGGKALFVATYLPGDGRQLRVKRELIHRFEGKREVTDKQVAATQMKDLLDKVARKYPDLERDAALAKIGRENFRKYVREDPSGYAGMIVTKMWNVWRRGSGPTMRAGGWITFHYAMLGLALVGLAVLAWRRRWEALVLATLIGGITLLGGLLLAVPRRNVPLMPLVLTLAAAGAVWLAITAGGWLAERRRARKRAPGHRVREA
jgi:4-amino-4-deoxy-L-arabinose transferase-like glycosyltransferase